MFFSLESKHLKSVSSSQSRTASDLQTHWAEKSDLLLEGRHYFAESEDVAVFFLPMDAIDSAAKDPFRSGRWEMTAIYEVSLGIPSSSFDSSN